VATVEAQRDVVASAVVALADPAARPAVFHCTSGRDRTGILAALVLDLLGVSDDVIAADYVLSVDSRRARDAYLREHEPERAAFFASLPASVLAIDASTMEQFLRELRTRHGSVRTLLEAGGAPAAALDRLVDDLVDRAME
jgi:protein-tyrosine phosphatase